jgi:hypothetical protein
MAYAPKAQKTSVLLFIPGLISITQIFLNTGLVLLRSYLINFLSINHIAFLNYIKAILNLLSKALTV